MQFLCKMYQALPLFIDIIYNKTNLTVRSGMHEKWFQCPRLYSIDYVIISKRWLGKDLEGSCRGLIERPSRNFLGGEGGTEKDNESLQ
jgi:hypothetical protein